MAKHTLNFIVSKLDVSVIKINGVKLSRKFVEEVLIKNEEFMNLCTQLEVQINSAMPNLEASARKALDDFAQSESGNKTVTYEASEITGIRTKLNAEFDKFNINVDAITKISGEIVKNADEDNPKYKEFVFGRRSHLLANPRNNVVSMCVDIVKLFFYNCPRIAHDDLSKRVRKEVAMEMIAELMKDPIKSYKRLFLTISNHKDYFMFESYIKKYNDLYKQRKAQKPFNFSGISKGDEKEVDRFLI
jgi:hypothetical protein